MLSLFMAGRALGDESRRRLGLGLTAVGGVTLVGSYAAVNSYGYLLVEPHSGQTSCDLGEHCTYEAAVTRPRGLYYPLVGGFLNAAYPNTAARELGIASSVLQIAGLSTMVAGIVVLATDRSGSRSTAQSVLPYVSANSIGVAGRF
jgi:hypothetical protein